MEVPCETSVQGGPTQELGHDATSENNHASGQIISLQEFNDIRTALCDRDAHASYLLQEMEALLKSCSTLSAMPKSSCPPECEEKQLAQDKEPEAEMYLKSASTIEMEAPVSEAPSHASSPVRKPCVVNLEFGGAPARGSRSGALQDWRGTDLNKPLVRRCLSLSQRSPTSNFFDALNNNGSADGGSAASVRRPPVKQASLGTLAAANRATMVFSVVEPLTVHDEEEEEENEDGTDLEVQPSGGAITGRVMHTRTHASLSPTSPHTMPDRVIAARTALLASRGSASASQVPELNPNSFDGKPAADLGTLPTRGPSRRHSFHLARQGLSASSPLSLGPSLVPHPPPSRLRSTSFSMALARRSSVFMPNTPEAGYTCDATSLAAISGPATCNTLPNHGSLDGRSGRDGRASQMGNGAQGTAAVRPLSSSGAHGHSTLVQRTQQAFTGPTSRLPVASSLATRVNGGRRNTLDAVLSTSFDATPAVSSGAFSTLPAWHGTGSGQERGGTPLGGTGARRRSIESVSAEHPLFFASNNSNTAGLAARSCGQVPLMRPVMTPSRRASLDRVGFVARLSQAVTDGKI